MSFWPHIISDLDGVQGKSHTSIRILQPFQDSSAGDEIKTQRQLYLKNEIAIGMSKFYHTNFCKGKENGLTSIFVALPFLLSTLH